MQEYDTVTKLTEVIYRVTMVTKRSSANERINKGIDSCASYEGIPLKEWSIETMPELLSYLLSLKNAVLNNAIGEKEVLDALATVDSSESIKTALNDIFYCETIHTDLNKKQLAKAVLYFFEQTGNHDHARMYIAPLQTDLGEMVTLLGLGKKDHEELWEEIMRPKMIQCDYYTNIAFIVFELLRKKKMLLSIGM